MVTTTRRRFGPGAQPMGAYGSGYQNFRGNMSGYYGALGQQWLPPAAVRREDGTPPNDVVHPQVQFDPANPQMGGYRDGVWIPPTGGPARPLTPPHPSDPNAPKGKYEFHPDGSVKSFAPLEAPAPAGRVPVNYADIKWNAHANAPIAGNQFSRYGGPGAGPVVSADDPAHGIFASDASFQAYLAANPAFAQQYYALMEQALQRGEINDARAGGDMSRPNMISPGRRDVVGGGNEAAPQGPTPPNAGAYGAPPQESTPDAAKAPAPSTKPENMLMGEEAGGSINPFEAHPTLGPLYDKIKRLGPSSDFAGDTGFEGGRIGSSVSENAPNVDPSFDRYATAMEDSGFGIDQRTGMAYDPAPGSFGKPQPAPYLPPTPDSQPPLPDASAPVEPNDVAPQFNNQTPGQNPDGSWNPIDYPPDLAPLATVYPSHPLAPVDLSPNLEPPVTLAPVTSAPVNAGLAEPPEPTFGDQTLPPGFQNDPPSPYGNQSLPPGFQNEPVLSPPIEPKDTAPTSTGGVTSPTDPTLDPTDPTSGGGNTKT